MALWRRVRNEGDDEAGASFLDVAPPSWAARGLAWVLIVLAAAAAAASVVIRLPETVSSPFVLVPARGADPIRASRSGIIAAVSVGEGQTVARGDPVFVIQSPSIGDRSAELRSLETQLGGVGDNRVNVREKYQSQRRVAHLAQRLAEQRRIRVVREMRFRGDLAIQKNEIDITIQGDRVQAQHHAIAPGAGRPPGARPQGRDDQLARVQQPPARGRQARRGEAAARAHAGNGPPEGQPAHRGAREAGATGDLTDPLTAQSRDRAVSMSRTICARRASTDGKRISSLSL